MKDTPDQIQKFIESIPDKFNIVETGIDIKIQQEYVEYSGSFEQGELSENETLFLSNLLFDKDKPLEMKKKVLVLLAHLGTILAYRQIEKFVNETDKELKEWATIALHECKMFLENELLDENMGLIMSGLGGLENRLRFYFLLLPLLSGMSFTKTQKNVIDKEIPLVCKDLNCIMESIDISDAYAGITVLVPHDVALGTLLETGIKKCNEMGEFLLEHYYATNTNIPDAKEIEDVIKIVREG